MWLAVGALLPYRSLGSCLLMVVELEQSLCRKAMPRLKCKTLLPLMNADERCSAEKIANWGTMFSCLLDSFPVSLPLLRFVRSGQTFFGSNLGIGGWIAGRQSGAIVFQRPITILLYIKDSPKV